MSLPAVLRVRSADGTDLALHDLGGDGSHALFAHATGFHGLVWRACAAELGGELHAWAPDLRGHGDSRLADGPLAERLEWDRFADDLLAVVDFLGAGPLLGVGHSKGGAALLLAEQRRPGTFRALYLYEPIVFPTDVAAMIAVEDHPLATGAQRRRPSFPSYDEAEANFAAKPPLSVLRPDVLHDYVRHGFAPDGDDPVGPVHLKCRPEIEAEVYRQGSRHHAFAHLSGVPCPVTVACGTEGPFSPANFAPAIAEALPHGRLVRHADLEHFGPLADPGAVAADIRAAFGLS